IWTTSKRPNLSRRLQVQPSHDNKASPPSAMARDLPLVDGIEGHRHLPQLGIVLERCASRAGRLILSNDHVADAPQVAEVAVNGSVLKGGECWSEVRSGGTRVSLREAGVIGNDQFMRSKVAVVHARATCGKN